MDQPKVSIIIPCYRQGHYLPFTIDDALAQTYPNLEVIVINDGSDDNTEEIARRYGGKIRYHWQTNQGLSAARNTGLKLATGTYVHFLDSDDRLHPDAIRWLAKKAAGREDVMCVMGFRRFERDDEDLEECVCVMPSIGEPLALSLLRTNIAPPVSFLCPRRMLMELGAFNTNLKSCEDWDAWQRMVLAGADILPVLNIGAYYRIHPQSMSKNQKRMADSKAMMLEMHVKRLPAARKRLQELGANPDEIQARAQRDLIDAWCTGGLALREAGDFDGEVAHYRTALRRFGWRWKIVGRLVYAYRARIMRKKRSNPVSSAPAGQAAE